jgi:trk system potassium uptake protein TrkH
MAVVLPVSAAIVLAVMASAYPTLGKGVRVAVFETVTSLTTTGFSTVGYYEWRPLAVLVLTVLMLIGAGTYSTGGGIKQFRVYLLSKSFVWDLRGALLPRGAVVEHPFWQGDDKVFLRESDLRRIGTFVFIYIAAWLVGAGVISACGFALRDALFESASAVGTVGISIGVTSPNLAPVALWTMSVQMFLGRLEFLVVFVSLLKILRDALAACRRG